jgi:hypothetical protein
MVTIHTANCNIKKICILATRDMRMRWAENVSCTWEKGNTYWSLLGKPEGRTHLEDLGVHGDIILNRV